MFAGELKSLDDFLPREEVAASTLALGFYTPAELAHVARPDHASIITTLVEYLKAQYP
jgi:hypothetical protein